MPPLTAHMPSDADLGGPVIVTIHVELVTHALFLQPDFLCWLMGTYIHWVLLYAWVLLFQKWIETGLMDTYVHRVLVIYGYLYSRVYGMYQTSTCREVYKKQCISYFSRLTTLVRIYIARV